HRLRRGALAPPDDRPQLDPHARQRHPDRPPPMARTPSPARAAPDGRAIDTSSRHPGPHGRRPPLTTITGRGIRHDVAVPGTQPLVSRQLEIDLVAAELARDGSGGVALRGPAGVGKSRLAQECADRAATEGCSVVVVRATESARNVPFGAMAALLPALGN